MQKRIRVFPYKQGSQSAKELAQGLGLRRIRLQSSTFLPRTRDVIINWGSTQCNYSKGTIINPAQAVAKASNKLSTFLCLAANNVPFPVSTTDKEQAQAWVAEGSTVYGRQTLTGTQGQGIVIFNTDNPEVTACPLYTKATKAKVEYRVHVVEGKVIDYVQKKKRLNFEGGIRGIRNHANGWVFARVDVVVPESVQTYAKQAVQALGLNFGAVDIGYIPDTDTSFVYEVNTAPGLEGTTLTKYIEAFKENYHVPTL